MNKLEKANRGIAYHLLQLKYLVEAIDLTAESADKIVNTALELYRTCEGYDLGFCGDEVEALLFDICEMCGAA